nr:MAG TPA: hypothetical protein [Crassvirales sp.]
MPQFCYPMGFLSHSSICFHIVQRTFSRFDIVKIIIF